MSSPKASITSAQAQFASLFQQQPVTSLSFSGDSNSLAVAAGNDVILCDSSTWFPNEDAALRTSFERLSMEGDETVGQVAYSPNLSMLAVTTAVEPDASECRLLLYRLSGTGDNTSRWEKWETRSLSTKGRNVVPVRRLS